MQVFDESLRNSMQRFEGNLNPDGTISESNYSSYRQRYLTNPSIAGLNDSIASRTNTDWLDRLMQVGTVQTL